MAEWTDAAKEARREYNRKWAREHKENRAESNRRYWARKAERLQAEKQRTEPITDAARE